MTSPLLDTDDHYAVLGVSRDASGRQIRKAYFQLVRQHTPEDAPEMFRRVAEAYRVLSHPDSRAEYDAAERIAPEVLELLGRIEDALQQDDQRAAERLAVELFRDHGHEPLTRMRAGIVFLRTSAHKSAAKIFHDLHEAQPEDASYPRLLAVALAELGREQDAKRFLRLSLRLDPTAGETYLILTGILTDEEDYAGAVAVLDRGIHADGKVDLADLPLFVRKILVLSQERKWDAMRGTAGELLGLLPAGDRDARAYVAQEFMRLAALYDRSGLPHLAKFAVDCATQAVPEDEDIAEISERIADDAEVYWQGEEALADPAVRKWLRGLIALWFATESPEAEREERYRQVLAFASRRGPRIVDDWKRMRERYPALARAMNRVWQDVRAVCRY